MNTPLDQKSSVDEIRKRFDGDVERFSNLDTGQKALVDAPKSMELIAQGAFRSIPVKLEYFKVIFDNSNWTIDMT